MKLHQLWLIITFYWHSQNMKKVWKLFWPINFSIFFFLLIQLTWLLCGDLLKILFFGYFVLIWWQTTKKNQILKQSCKLLCVCFFFFLFVFKIATIFLKDPSLTEKTPSHLGLSCSVFACVTDRFRVWCCSDCDQSECPNDDKSILTWILFRQ